jgi:hypothetical protein
MEDCMAQKGSPGPDWKHAWRNAKTGDDVYLHEDDGSVFLDVAPRGHDHADGIYCHLCLPRLNEMGDAARKCLDPSASAFVEAIPVVKEGPEYIALVTFPKHGTEERSAYAMRQDGGVRIVSTKPILTTKKDNNPFTQPIVLADYQTKAHVCSADYIKSFSVRLKDGVPEHYARRLWEAKFTFEIDDEKLVGGVPFKEILQRKEIILPEPIPGRMIYLFSACEVENPVLGKTEVNADKWLGYTLPNLSRIRATLDGVQGGGGLIFIETSWKLINYTTKPKPSVT